MQVQKPSFPDLDGVVIRVVIERKAGKQVQAIFRPPHNKTEVHTNRGKKPWLALSLDWLRLQRWLRSW